MKTESKAVNKKKLSMFREVYPIEEPHVYATIVRDPASQKMRYEVIEPTLREREKNQLREIKDILVQEINVSLKDLETKEMAKEYLKNKVRQIIRDYRMKVAEEAVDKLMYYIVRNFIGYGKIDPLMKDHMIEDVSADGVNIPIYVWHREYESLPTNIIFEGADELNSFVIRLAYLARKHISIARPILDAALPDGSRVQLTYGNEITRRGSTFTIRRFRVDPLTISDLIALKTLSSDIAAYFWYAIENRASILVAGGVAAGKTTTLNCLSMFIKPELKIVSVEDTAELNLPHENWIPSVVRPGFGSGEEKTGAITLFDLLKAAVRQRPDYIIVGEVRGEEVYTLFQAMATGHLGMSTVHAESVDAVFNRLESEPMNIPRALLTMIDVVMVQLRTEIRGKPARRALTVTEVMAMSPKTKELLTNNVYRWDSKSDAFLYSGRSYALEKNMKKMGLGEGEVRAELHRRKTVLEWMVKNNIRRYTDVASVIREYYADPDRVYRRARVGAL
ncbi:MAG: type II/IV secretion system ATPase subunit [Candidatus Bathyarchaeota archaeon]|nr:type II/IV secretion system ATPase subunit [Candidatus Bathyarchaeota archaeon]MDH5531904.1 type II/IV secretion system ATPase subunit [Candidatus Bathyarchaeota archaeon]MDH5712629.1 type II/IV secretion system ATPase subunit [Candidatus Bathyarchaeota archaeon]